MSRVVIQSLQSCVAVMECNCEQMDQDQTVTSSPYTATSAQSAASKLGNCGMDSKGT